MLYVNARADRIIYLTDAGINFRVTDEQTNVPLTTRCKRFGCVEVIDVADVAEMLVWRSY